jgi:hypothetical protein
MQYQINNKMQHQSPCQHWPSRLNHGWIYYIGYVELTHYWIKSGQLQSKLWWNYNRFHNIHIHFNYTDTFHIHWATHQYMWIKSVGIGSNHLPIITNISHSSIAQKSSRLRCHIIIHMESVDLVYANAFHDNLRGNSRYMYRFTHECKFWRIWKSENNSQYPKPWTMILWGWI